MSQLIITRGLPASGKTTYARAWVQEDPANRIRLNRDELRRMLHADIGRTTNGLQENLITKIQQDTARQALRAGPSALHRRADGQRGALQSPRTARPRGFTE